jgi:pimeloyl-ACP methyl ester carboxylesterase
MQSPASLLLPPRDHFSWSADNVRLHWREWPGPPDAASRPALLCVPGLTRNIRDFEPLANHLAGQHRIIAISLRGRGESGYAQDKLSYVPLVYLKDIGTIVADAGLDRFILVGTSLGGLIGLMLPLTHRDAMAGLVLNDLGPTLEPAGLARVREQVRRGGDGWPSWLMAARDIGRRQADIYPGFSLEDWLGHAKRLCRVSREGRIVFDYDPEIAAPMDLPHNDDTMDLWAAFDGVRHLPILSLRGAGSDILSADTQAAMAARHPGLTAVTIPGVGHAPTLFEPDALAAIKGFLDQVPGGVSG